MADRLTVGVNVGERTTALVYRAAAPRRGVTLVLAHGAGAPQQSRFMVRFAGGLAARGLDVVTFNFLYMEQRRKTPDRTDTLEACYRAVIDRVRDMDDLAGNVLMAGGKSMGGRLASHLAAAAEIWPTPDTTTANAAVANAARLASADRCGVRLPPSREASAFAEATADQAIRGLVFLGYPLHPPGKPAQLRSAHLPRIKSPMLFVQGARDPFGTPDELRPILDTLPASTTLHVVAGGDHSLAPPKSGAAAVDDTYDAIMDVIVNWIVRMTNESMDR